MMTSFTTRLVELWPVLVLSQVAYWKVVLALEALWDRAEAFGGFSGTTTKITNTGARLCKKSLH